MDRTRFSTLLRSWALSFSLSFGSLQCLASGFGLPREQWLAILCCAGGLACSLMLLHRGNRLIVCIGALAAGYLWRLELPLQQTLWLVQHISRTYHLAYGWGWLRLTEGEPGCGYALDMLGWGICLAVSRCICRGKGPGLPLAAALFPLALCLGTGNAVPEPLPLLLLLSGAGVLLLSAQVHSQPPKQGNRLAVMAAVPVAAALGLMLLCCPQKSYVNHSAALRQRLFSAAASVPGGPERRLSLGFTAPPETLSLSALGPRQPETAAVMTVTAGQSGALYLRERDYDCYDGTTWSSREQRREEFGIALSVSDQVSIRTQTPRERLLLPYYPAEAVTLTGGGVENREGLTEYTVPRVLLQHTQITKAHPVPVEAASFLALPDSTRQGAEDLLAAWKPGGVSASQTARSIGSLLRREGHYDLSPKVMDAGAEDFALWFLAGEKRGYCVHFATAAAVLLRAAGVPARFVTGYLVQTRAGQEILVTQADAHAWVEFYEPGLGQWLILEATPAASVPEEAGSLPTEAAAAAPQVQAVHPRSHPWLILPALLAVQVQRILRLLLRRLRQRRGSPNRQALAKFQEAALLSRLLGKPPAPALVTLAQKAKFSPHTLTPEELSVFDAGLLRSRQALKQKSFHLRLVYRYLYALY